MKASSPMESSRKVFQKVLTGLSMKANFTTISSTGGALRAGQMGENTMVIGCKANLWDLDTKYTLTEVKSKGYGRKGCLSAMRTE